MSRTVLVADDDPDVRDLVDWSLRADGYRVIRAEDGLEALRRFSEEAVDLLVLDLYMPLLDGPGLLATIRKDRQRAHVPVIMMTADPQSAPNLGVDIVVPKPFAPSDLVKTVRSLLGDPPLL